MLIVAATKRAVHIVSIRGKRGAVTGGAGHVAGLAPGLHVVPQARAAGRAPAAAARRALRRLRRPHHRPILPAGARETLAHALPPLLRVQNAS